jgi:alkanesulfonate monooxygenase SsuD/methylene tetrahydromethanopterin reductase-like flavin-dependent oxidoreductase (luciferase family)
VKFSTQNLLSLRDWQSHAEVYADAIEECRLADSLGFHTIWLAEHHFSPYGICPSLAPLAGALARETRRARIGTAVVIAPFEHPVRIAEEWAEIDILSGGRLEFGLGRGYQPKEFHGLAVSMAAPAAVDGGGVARHLHAGRPARAQDPHLARLHPARRPAQELRRVSRGVASRARIGRRRRDLHE